ncbi:MAG: MFS transporter [Candidatus Lokiarchaeota archaeon]|nr:MFS transporter [Candidatus Lokiarchaeota archaeon]MBD3199466.1 MFS transporter [Candidatus Lokiarchaeota archaeon]
MVENNKTFTERSKKYFIFMMIVLALVQIMDAYTTSYTAAFPSKVIQEFLVIPYGINETTAQALMQIIIAIATIGTFFVFFNQFLSDKFGRKTMLFVTTLGMGLSALLLALSVNIILYTIFLFSTYLFFSSDMWLIYAGEEAPPTKKALYTNYLLACGILGPIMMPLLRSVFITESSPVWAWRGMTLLPILLGIPLSFVIFFTIKETKIYEMGKLSGEIDKSQIFLVDNVKKLFQSSQKKPLKALVLMSFFAGLNFNLLQLAESFLATNTTLTEKDVNLVITLIAVSVILGYLITGVLADKIGRIPLLYVTTILVPVASVLLYIGSLITSNVFIVVALAVSLAYVGYNGILIVIRIMVTELVPTEKRGTGLGVRSFSTSFGITGGFLIGSLITILVGDLGISFIILSLPTLINLYLIPKFIPETKGTDLSEVELRLKQ